MSSESGSLDQAGVTGETLLEAQFDRSIASYLRWYVSGILLITVAGIPLIPFWLLWSLWYGPEYVRRLSARLTTQALEIRKGVFFRSESTIPLNRITDLRIHDGPLMRHHTLRGLKVETAGQSGATGSEGDMVGVIDAIEFRDAVLRQRQKVLDAEQAAESAATGGAADVLTEIRDILARIEAAESAAAGEAADVLTEVRDILARIEAAESAAAGGAADILTEVRDILARIEAKG